MELGDLRTLSRAKLLNIWGDYGSVLWHGITENTPDGIELSRAGPFVPPISFPSRTEHVIVSAAVRDALVDESVNDSTCFDRVKLRKIVNIPWEKEDWQKGIPDSLIPDSVEPRNMIHEGKHCEETALLVADQFWLWNPPLCGSVSREGGHISFHDILTSEYDAFRVNDRFYRDVFVTTKARKVLLEHASKWIEFETIV